MHTTAIGDYRFHHNGDYSGDVIVINDLEEVTIPFEVLRDFVGGALRDTLIGDLERMDELNVFRVFGAIAAPNKRRGRKTK